MGLFDDPYKFSNNAREAAAMNNPAHVAAARSMAAKSIVLLKNSNNILPLSKNLKKIAFVGPLVKSLLQNKGFWDVSIPTVDSNFIVSQWEGLQNKVGPATSLLYAKGCEIEGDNKSGFSEAVAIANQADVVILSIGEKRDMSGEAKSRSNINIPGVQEELLQALLATGKPVVVLINAGRPLVFNYTAKNATAILYTWWLGSEAGNAIADVLFGDYNPSAKLPMTFPMSVGQIPIYYNHFNTGRPATDDNNHIYNSSYLDESIFPKFPFGFGLSYTTFAYSNLALSKKAMNMKDSIAVSFTLTNTGQQAGEEVVQLYLHNKRASVVMPVKALKDFQKIMLQPGESKKIKFNINKEKLSFYNANLKWDAEPTDFDLMIGSSSEDLRLKESFELKK
jgi:beta-glucosidase